MSNVVIEYEGWNGELFTLLGKNEGDRGVVLLDSPEEFYDTPIETIQNQTAFGRGARYGGFKYEAMYPTFTVDISTYNGMPWRRNLSEWRKAWAPDKTGRLWFRTPTSDRYLKVRLHKAPKSGKRMDPNKSQGEQYTMYPIAGDPFWYSEPIPQRWVSEVSTLGGNTNGGIIVGRNDSSIEVWPQWRAMAPGIATLPDFSFGDNRENRAYEDRARLVDLAQTVPGEHVLVDTDPAAFGGQYQTALNTPFHMRMNGVRFCYPFPAGMEQTELYVEMTKAPAGVAIELIVPQPWLSPEGLE